MISGNVNVNHLHWEDILHLTVSIKQGTVTMSQVVSVLYQDC